MKLRIRRSKKGWTVAYRLAGKAKRYEFRTLEAAQQAGILVRSEVRDQRAFWTSLSPFDRSGIAITVARMQATGVTVMEAWSFWERNHP